MSFYEGGGTATATGAIRADDGTWLPLEDLDPPLSVLRPGERVHVELFATGGFEVIQSRLSVRTEDRSVLLAAYWRDGGILLRPEDPIAVEYATELCETIPIEELPFFACGDARTRRLIARVEGSAEVELIASSAARVGPFLVGNGASHEASGPGCNVLTRVYDVGYVQLVER